MTAATGLWDELLTGEELAHLTTEPARGARTAPGLSWVTASGSGAS